MRTGSKSWMAWHAAGWCGRSGVLFLAARRSFVRSLRDAWRQRIDQLQECNKFNRNDWWDVFLFFNQPSPHWCHNSHTLTLRPFFCCAHHPLHFSSPNSPLLTNQIDQAGANIRDVIYRLRTATATTRFAGQNSCDKINFLCVNRNWMLRLQLLGISGRDIIHTHTHTYTIEHRTSKKGASAPQIGVWKMNSN